jgi:hypothetical protein
MELKVEETVSKYLNEGKMKFVELMYEGQGRKQFPFDSLLTEEEYNPTKYHFSRVLKLPGETPTFEQIATKYEAVINDRYPILDYLLKNTINFKHLMNFNYVIKACNAFWESANGRLTRGHCKGYTVSAFMEQMCKGREENAKELI